MSKVPLAHFQHHTDANAVTTPEDTLYATGTVEEDFSFNDRVAEVFDDMLNRSVPYYRTVIDGMAQLLASHLSPGAVIYDLGCSTGTTLLELARRLPDQGFRFIGIDNAPAMLDKARTKSALFTSGQMLRFEQDDITTCPLPQATAILCNYTLQFLRPLSRQTFIDRIHAALPEGGVFLLSEKTISPCGRINRDFIEIHHSFKNSRGTPSLKSQPSARH